LSIASTIFSIEVLKNLRTSSEEVLRFFHRRTYISDNRISDYRQEDLKTFLQKVGRSSSTDLGKLLPDPPLAEGEWLIGGG